MFAQMAAWKEMSLLRCRDAGEVDDMVWLHRQGEKPNSYRRRLM